jgi:hypothetical protein
MADQQQVADEDIAVLRTQKEAAEKRAQEAEERERTASAERDQFRSKVQQEINNRVQADEAAVASAISAAETMTETLESQYADAAERQDYRAMATIQSKLADARFDLRQHQNSRHAIDNWKKQQLAAAEKAREQQQQNRGGDDPYANYTPRTRKWLQDHPEIANNQQKMARAMSAHFDAVADGLTPESDDYFKFIEKRIGATPAGDRTSGDGDALSTASQIDDADSGLRISLEEQERQRQERREASQAAAPSRQMGDQPRRPPGTVTLSRAEQEAARFSFPHLKTDEEKFREYARNKVALQSEGRL